MLFRSASTARVADSAMAAMRAEIRLVARAPMPPIVPDDCSRFARHSPLINRQLSPYAGAGGLLIMGWEDEASGISGTNLELHPPSP